MDNMNNSINLAFDFIDADFLRNCLWYYSLPKGAWPLSDFFANNLLDL